MTISVEGYGAITKSNAPEIYRAWKRGDIELNESQQMYLDQVLPDDVRYEIDGEKESHKQDGKNQIGDDVKNAESHGGQGGNVAATSAGAAVGGVVAGGGSLIFGEACKIAAQMLQGKTSSNGWVAVVCGAIIAAGGALCLVSASKFDNGYDDRCKARDNADSTNQTIDANTDALLSSMAAMADDADAYNEANDELTQKMNGHVADQASLEDRLATAQMAGDKAEIEKIKEELKKNREMMIADEEGSELQDILKNIDEYRSANELSGGVSEGGRTVSDFLKQGTVLGVFATINAVALTVATAAMAIGAVSAYASFKSIFDIAPAIAGGVLWLVGMGLTGAAALKMAKKAKNEFECGSAGGDMGSKVDALDNMRVQQDAYVETNLEGYEKSDEDEQKDRDKAKDQAEGSKTGVGSKGPQPNPNNPNDPNKGNGNGDGDGDK